MAWFLGQSSIIILIAFLLGLLIGWLLWGRIRMTRRASPRSATAAPVSPAAVAVPAPRHDPTDAEPVSASTDPPRPAVRTPEPVRPATSQRPPERTPAAPPEHGSAAEPALRSSRPRPTPESTHQPEPDPSTPPEPDPSTPPEPDPSTPPEPDPSTPREPESGDPWVRPVAVPVAVPVQRRTEAGPDDLQRIEGIGPKMADALHAAGITTYTQLGASDEVTIRAAIAAARLRFAPSLPTWPRQAQLLAAGDEAGHAELIRRLVGGRDTGRKR